MTLITALQDSAQHLTTYNREEGKKGKGNSAHLQSCDANPDSQASGHDTDNGLPGVAVTIKAVQLACQPERQIGQTAGAPGGMSCKRLMRWLHLCPT